MVSHFDGNDYQRPAAWRVASACSPVGEVSDFVRDKKSGMGEPIHQHPVILTDYERPQASGWEWKDPDVASSDMQHQGILSEPAAVVVIGIPRWRFGIAEKN
jgi:hypothetical protein